MKTRDKNIVVLSGAGMSAESGIATFRDAGGLWEGHDVMEVASPAGWNKNRQLVNTFYNARRRDLLGAKANAAHLFLACCESDFVVNIITQNVDDLHERAGSTQVLHLHGELRKVRSEDDETLIYTCDHDLTAEDKNEEGHSLRPHIVWFGEAVPALAHATKIVEQADLLIIIGTSLQVYPAAGLSDFCRKSIPVIYVDPKPSYFNSELFQHFHLIKSAATAALPELDKLIKRYLNESENEAGM